MDFVINIFYQLSVKINKLPIVTLTNKLLGCIIVIIAKTHKITDVYKMILNYKECVEKYGSSYQLEKALSKKIISQIEKGVYSENPYVPELAVIIKKYPKAVLTGEYAFYYHQLTDIVPEKYFLATKSKAAKISDSRVFQEYVRDDLFECGIEKTEIEGVRVRMYDKERMLIEVLRKKNIMPYDMYKEIIRNYRKIVESLEIWRIQEYAEKFPKSKMIKKALREEVF